MQQDNTWLLLAVLIAGFLDTTSSRRGGNNHHLPKKGNFLELLRFSVLWIACGFSVVKASLYCLSPLFSVLWFFSPTIAEGLLGELFLLPIGLGCIMSFGLVPALFTLWKTGDWGPIRHEYVLMRTVLLPMLNPDVRLLAYCWRRRTQNRSNP